MNYKKILVIGASGSGKSTLAKKIAEASGITYVPTDPFYWDADWQVVADNIVGERVMAVLQQPDWVMDGNFDTLHEEVWGHADCIIWLNLPYLTVMHRVISRNLRWWVTQKQIWSGNRMSFQHAINGIRHAMRSYGKKKRDYPQWLKELRDVDVFVFTSSRNVREWLKKESSGS